MKSVERSRYNGKIPFETRTLTFEPFQYSEIEMVMKLIAENLSPDLLTKKYRKKNEHNPMFGHCYHSSQALYYLIETDVLQPMSAIDYHDCPHWWLEDTSCNKIYDVTSDQYYHVGQVPPYDAGKKKKWYGWQQRPHQRSLNLMIRVLGDRLIEDRVDKLKPAL